MGMLCWRKLLAVLAAGAICSCHPPPPEPPDPQAELIARGRQIFFNETFNGNGRTCGTCHPAGNNLTLDAQFIATLPNNDPLFVAEFNPALSRNFENPRLMRQFGLILENQDGFDDLANKFNMRGIPHTLGMRTSVASPNGPRTGWSGDGAPGDGSLRSFATGAVIQHFTKTLTRVAGVDFRLPTDEELDALEAFQLSLGRQADPQLPLRLKGVVARRGQEIFMDATLGKCTFCHFNAGANAIVAGQDLGNANFNTGVEQLPDQPARLTSELVPIDDGFGFPGDGTFNTPPLVESASTPPFFHNNSIATIEGAVAFYDGDTFNNSPSGVFLASVDPEGKGIELDGTQISAIAAFLRVINALDNIRESIELLQTSIMPHAPFRESPDTLPKRAMLRTDDCIRVLTEAQLHPTAVMHLREAKRFIHKALKGHGQEDKVREAIRSHELARSELVE
jgi:hypothetical protein